MLMLDHLVVATDDLARGTDWMAARLGVAPGGGGRHDAFGTHNALWKLGAAYLELIAIDPDAPRPGRPRWFGLDDPATRSGLADRPRLLTWVARSDDLDGDIRRSPLPTGPAQRFSRDHLYWHLTVPQDGRPHWGGAYPALIAWPPEVSPPPDTLPDSGLHLIAFAATGPEGLRRDLSLLGADQVLDVSGIGTDVALSATVRRSDGSTVVLD